MGTVQVEDSGSSQGGGPEKGGFALFSYGFRPFFLVAGVFGAVAVPVWTLMVIGGLPPWTHLAPGLWHAHEMLYGFAVAAMTGFFLTVVPNWTGRGQARGPVLMGLVGLWLMGRVGFWLGSALPAALVAVVDGAFLLALLAVITPPLLAPQQRRRQFLFVPLVAVMAVGNLLILIELLGLADTGARGVRLGLDGFLVLLTLMGGRVTPSFTSSWLGHQTPGVRVVSRPGLEKAVILGTVGLMVLHQLVPDGGWFMGGYTAVLAGLHGARMAGWQSLKTLKNPILWALHLGYAWIVVGLGLRAVSFFDGGAFLGNFGADHAITIGAVGTMVLAIMSRASLGHTGRPVVAAPVLVLAYGLVSVSAGARVAMSVTSFVDASDLLLMISSGAWTAAFVFFCWIYVPILIRPRVDGRDG